MKFLDKLALKIFSIIILVAGVLGILYFFDMIPVREIQKYLVLMTDVSVTTIRIALGVFVVLMLLAIKGLFFTSKPDDNGKNGIILENSNGKLVLSKESLDNLIATVIKDVPGAESVSSRTYLDRHNGVIINIVANVSKELMIKDVTNDIQLRIKDIMKRTADLEVKEVNIKIKNVVSKKIKGLPSPQEENEPEENDENVENENGEENN